MRASMVMFHLNRALEIMVDNVRFPLLITTAWLIVTIIVFYLFRRESSRLVRPANPQRWRR